jgi:hypothetical protein
MNLRRASLAILLAGGLTIGLNVGLVPHGARGQQPAPPAAPPSSTPGPQFHTFPIQSPVPTPFPLQGMQPTPAVDPQEMRSLFLGQPPAPYSPMTRGLPVRPLAKPSPLKSPAKPVVPVETDDKESPVSSWRSKPTGADDDDEIKPQPPKPQARRPTQVDDDDIKPQPARQPRRYSPLDDEDEIKPLPPRQADRHPAADEDENRENEPKAKSDSYAGNVFGRGQSGEFIEYASFRSVAAAPSQRVVNSKKIALQFQVKNAGPSGVSLVEVWRTCDGRTWELFSKAVNSKPPLYVEVEKEGLYGFTIIPRSGVGLGRPAPVSGEAPQLWVEVDLTPPEVKLGELLVGSGRDSGKLTINWSAKDKNLGPEAITISYAEEMDGPWRPFATRLANTGKYVWQIPEKTPYRFFVRVHAVDRGGNIGSAETAKPIIVDLSTPESVILGADGVAK